MKINNKSGLVASGIAGMMMLIAPAAYAASTVIVDGSTAPGQVAVTGVNKGTFVFKTTGNSGATCATSVLGGKINRGAAATSGSVIGQIDSLNFGFCSAIGPVIVEKSTDGPASWDIEFMATPAKGSATAPIVIRDVALKLHSTGAQPWVCNLDAEGDVTGTFNQTTQQLIIYTPPAFSLDLTTYAGSGSKVPAASTCLGLITTTQFASMDGSWTLSTPGVGGIHW